MKDHSRPSGRSRRIRPPTGRIDRRPSHGRTQLSLTDTIRQMDHAVQSAADSAKSATEFLQYLTQSPEIQDYIQRYRELTGADKVVLQVFLGSYDEWNSFIEEFPTNHRLYQSARGLRDMERSMKLSWKEIQEASEKMKLFEGAYLVESGD